MKFRAKLQTFDQSNEAAKRGYILPQTVRSCRSQFTKVRTSGSLNHFLIDWRQKYVFEIHPSGLIFVLRVFGLRLLRLSTSRPVDVASTSSYSP